MDFFEVNEGLTDIRMVYNGTSCGLNDTLWAPNFWLPTPVAAARVLGFGCYMVDIDLGEMFLKFPLPSQSQLFSGVDLRHYTKDMAKPMAKAAANGNHLVHWMPCWLEGSQTQSIHGGAVLLLGRRICPRKPIAQEEPNEMG
jgi:hypothetical protein